MECEQSPSGAARNMVDHANFSGANGNAALVLSNGSLSVSYEYDARVWTQLMVGMEEPYVYAAKQWGGSHLAERGATLDEIRDCLITTIIMFMLATGKSVNHVPDLPKTGY